MVITEDNHTQGIDRLNALKKKVDDLLMLDKITREDTIDFNELEGEYLVETINSRLEQLRDTARDQFIEKIDGIMPPCTKRDVWEYNNTIISQAYSKLMNASSVMPTKQAISMETGLSRQTVAKHLKEYKHHPAFIAEMEEFKFLTPNIMVNIYKTAIKGDAKAARLFLEMIGQLNRRPNNTVVNEQTNNIQINNTILNPENLKRLSREQLEQIEMIIISNGRSA